MTIEKLLSEFKIYKIDIEGKNENSIDLYIKNIKEFLEEMEINDYNTLVSVDAQVIKDWIISLTEKGNSAKTRNNKLTSVKQIFLYLEDEKMENIDRRINKIKNAKTPQKEVKYVDMETIEEILRVVKRQRTRAAIVILQKTGIRFNELMQITCQDIERGYAIINGKGNKERKIWFSPDCIKICQDFINGERKKIVEKYNLDTDILLLSDGGKLMTTESFTRSLKQYANKIGLVWANEMSPHKLRHAFISDQLNRGVPVHIVRDMVGHQNMSTTNGYAHTNKDTIKQVFLEQDIDKIYNE